MITDFVRFVFFFLFFFTERIVTHKLFTPLLTGMVTTGVFLILILVVLFYKYMQVSQRVAMRGTLQLIIFKAVEKLGKLRQTIFLFF